MKIIHTIASLAIENGGPSYTVSSLAGYQTPLIDGSVNIVHSNREDDLCIPQHYGVLLHNTSTNPFGHLLTTWSTLRRIGQDDVTILHDHGIWNSHSFVASVYALVNNLPTVVSPRGMLEPWALSYKPIKKRIARFLYQDSLLKRASCVVATSAQELDNLRKLGLTNPIAIIPNGVDAIRDTKRKPTTKSIKTALFLSRVHPKKGLIHAIEAWNIIRPNDWRLKIVGPSEVGHRNELERLVGKYDLGNHVSFHDMVSGEEKIQVYQDADLFLFPTYSENFGVVVAEALSSGIPVLTTTGTPWKELIDRRCGWVIETGTEPLVSALRSILVMPADELIEMGERGRQWVASAFHWPRIAANSILVYDWVLGVGEKPDFIFD